MLFTDILDAKKNIIQPEFERLFELAIENQHHSNDLLLLVMNGFYTPNVFDMGNGVMSSHYVIGPGTEGHSESLHYDFIHAYRSSYISEKHFTDYLVDLEFSPEKQQIIAELIETEGLTIQMEMLVYLKVWEMSQFLKNLYEFVRILKGEHYDWHFKLKTGDDQTGIASAQELIRIHIRDEIRVFSQPIYEMFQSAYKSQIRNSIAHSNYSFQGRNIHPNNKKLNATYPQIGNLPFDEWIEMFHSTIMLYNSYIWLKNKINMHFGELAITNENKLEIRINKEDGSEVLSEVIFRPEYKDWRWA